jgi:hypothetical protein
MGCFCTKEAVIVDGNGFNTLRQIAQGLEKKIVIQFFASLLVALLYLINLLYF